MSIVKKRASTASVISYFLMAVVKTNACKKIIVYFTMRCLRDKVNKLLKKIHLLKQMIEKMLAFFLSYDEVQSSRHERKTHSLLAIER